MCALLRCLFPVGCLTWARLNDQLPPGFATHQNDPSIYRLIGRVRPTHRRPALTELFSNLKSAANEQKRTKTGIERTGDEVSADRYRLIADMIEADPSLLDILLFDSSSLWASFPDAHPELIGVAVTLDADFFIDPDDAATRQRLDEQLGEDNDHHQTHGDFVDLRLADAFPVGWRDHLVPMSGFSDVFALSPMDMAVSKVNATARSTHHEITDPFLLPHRHPPCRHH